MSIPYFSTIFNLPIGQGGLDFVDIRLDKDTPLYVDPFAISIKDDVWSQSCVEYINSFFEEVLSSLRSKDNTRAIHLMSRLTEPNETRLGVSLAGNSGRGVGYDKAGRIIGAIARSKALATGLLNDLSESALFVEGVGPDMVSDITTNIIRELLAQYTLDQCALHGVPTEHQPLPASWDVNVKDWVGRQYKLPKYKNRPILLVPRYSTRLRVSLDSQEFYNKSMTEALKAEYEKAGGSLVQVLKNGHRRVFKKDIKERHPFSKDALAEFIEKNPDVLERYKELKGAIGAPSPLDVDQSFSYLEFSQALLDILNSTPSGRQNATKYQSLVMGILTFC